MKLQTKIMILIGSLAVIYVAVCLVFYMAQERIGMHNQQLPKDHVFNCEKDFEEVWITVDHGISLNGVLVKADSKVTDKNAVKAILFLHGSGRCIDFYMKNASVYADLGYDVFLIDYRGYGKSEGKMESEDQFKGDLDIIYSYMTDRYEEKNLVLVGFSMGTFAASYLAAHNDPKLLILEAAPYWILEQFIDKYFFLPVRLLSKYSFATHEYVRQTKVPIRIYLGKEDHLSNETRWPEVLKPIDKLTILEGEAHSDYAFNELYMADMKRLLR